MKTSEINEKLVVAVVKSVCVTEDEEKKRAANWVTADGEKQ